MIGKRVACDDAELNGAGQPKLPTGKGIESGPTALQRNGREKANQQVANFFDLEKKGESPGQSIA